MSALPSAFVRAKAKAQQAQQAQHRRARAQTRPADLVATKKGLCGM